MICKKHPRYQAKRPPRADCEACRQIWEARKKIWLEVDDRVRGIRANAVVFDDWEATP